MSSNNTVRRCNSDKAARTFVSQNTLLRDWFDGAVKDWSSRAVKKRSSTAFRTGHWQRLVPTVPLQGLGQRWRWRLRITLLATSLTLRFVPILGFRWGHARVQHGRSNVRQSGPPLHVQSCAQRLLVGLRDLLHELNCGGPLAVLVHRQS